MKFSYSLLKTLAPGLPPARKLGEMLSTYSFEIDGVSGDVLDVKLPSNIYSYASSHVGLAREASIISGLAFRHRIKAAKSPRRNGLVAASIEAPELCRRYAARVFELSGMKALPPAMRKALLSCGINSINPVVDIMNYIMLETGQPLHAFDAERLGRGKGQRTKAAITVRRAKRGEFIETLDGKKIDLGPQTLVIADPVKPLAIAGIKGGRDSGVTPDTRTIIVEAANFEGVNIYKTSARLGIRTDASVRFSHHLSPALVGWGMERATELLKAMGAKLVDAVDVYPRPDKDAVVVFDPARYERLIGVGIPVSEAKRRFEALGFTAKAGAGRGRGTLRVTIPAWRNDIDSAADLAEELARFTGYNDLPKTAPEVELLPAEEVRSFRMKDMVREALVRLGCSEVYNTSFVGGAEIGAVPKEALVELENPIAEDKKFMRPNLMPLLRQNIVDNTRWFDAVKIFEVGMVFSRTEGGIAERLLAGLAIGGKKTAGPLLELKGIAEALLKELGIGEWAMEESDGRLLVRSGKTVLGEIREEALPRDFAAAFAEIDLSRCANLPLRQVRFEEPPKYPGIVRDLSFFLREGIKMGSLFAGVRMAGGEDLVRAELLDDYKDKASGKHAVTLRMLFQRPDRTLTDEEVGSRMQVLAHRLAEEFGIEIR